MINKKRFTIDKQYKLFHYLRGRDFANKFLVCLIFSALLFLFNSCLGGRDGLIESGAFDGIPPIDIIKPENRFTIVNELPDFRWETVRTGVNGIFPYELVIILDKEVDIDGKNLSKDFMEHSLWIWDSNRLGGVPGNVNLSEFFIAKTQEIFNGEYMFVFDENTQENEKPNLKHYIDSHTGFDGSFYWMVIQYESSGEIQRASKVFRFSFYETDVIDDGIIDEPVTDYGG